MTTACKSLYSAALLPILFAGPTALGKPEIKGEARQWHKLTLTFDGPQSAETASPNPFTDYRLDLVFRQGDRSLVVPGYFAADGDSANTSAESGNKWRVHFSAPNTGEWTWKASFRKGPGIATSEDPTAGESAGHFDGESGSITISASDKKAPDTRALGHLTYVGDRYPRTLGNDGIFIKIGVDAPENLLSYRDFDGGFASDGVKDQLVKNWEPHVRDWKEGDPSWKNGKGKGLIGAINYLASHELNSISFLTMNIEGDDANVFPYPDNKTFNRIDVSRMDQWEIVFSHATSKGMFLHFKTQESENEKLLDQGDLGPDRTLYYRELIARFGHHPALNWNMGEENGEWKNPAHQKEHQTTEQRLAMGRYFEKNDPYKRPIVIHNGQWPEDLYGPDSPYNGASLQTNKEDFSFVHRATLNILKGSRKKGKQWMVACDEPGDAQFSLVPDSVDPDHDNARQAALWGNLLAGGWGVEWYFGYKHPHSDLSCQDFRVREKMWKQCTHAHRFFRDHPLPLAKTWNHDELLKGAPGYCLADPGEFYLLMLRSQASKATLDLGDAGGDFKVHWFDPRHGGPLQEGSTKTISGKGPQTLGNPPSDSDKDWVVLIRK
ncbi:MAG: DUF5060 domain-containing protein [Verrucomicrobiota bacterium]